MLKDIFETLIIYTNNLQKFFFIDIQKRQTRINLVYAIKLTVINTINI